MSKVKVWLGGEGPSEIGDRDRPDGQRVGVIEALLLKVERDGWYVAGATVWRRITKLRVGAALGRDNHGDIHNVAGLVNEAHENACEVVAFARDIDSDLERLAAIAQGVSRAREIFPGMGIVGGPAVPTIEGWILALRNVPRTESMSRARVNELIAAQDLAGKHPEAYAEVIESADLTTLPPGCDCLGEWIATARSVLDRAIRGTPG